MLHERGLKVLNVKRPVAIFKLLDEVGDFDLIRVFGGFGDIFVLRSCNLLFLEYVARVVYDVCHRIKGSFWCFAH